MTDNYRDPEKHGFEIRPVNENDFMTQDGHRFEVINPSWGDSSWTSSTVFRFSMTEILDLYDVLGAYIEEMRHAP